jgi:hypothetical protein
VECLLLDRCFLRSDFVALMIMERIVRDSDTDLVPDPGAPRNCEDVGLWMFRKIRIG